MLSRCRRHEKPRKHCLSHYTIHCKSPRKWLVSRLASPMMKAVTKYQTGAMQYSRPDDSLECSNGSLEWYRARNKYLLYIHISTDCALDRTSLKAGVSPESKSDLRKCTTELTVHALRQMCGCLHEHLLLYSALAVFVPVNIN